MCGWVQLQIGGMHCKLQCRKGPHKGPKWGHPGSFPVVFVSRTCRKFSGFNLQRACLLNISCETGRSFFLTKHICRWNRPVIFFTQAHLQVPHFPDTGVGEGYIWCNFCQPHIHLGFESGMASLICLDVDVQRCFGLWSLVVIWALSQYKDRLIYVWRFPC